MDVGAAFTYIFDDKDWVKKVTIGGLASLLIIVLAPIFVIQGYSLQTLKNVRDGLSTPLPEWNNLGTLIVRGVTVSLLWLIFHLPAFLLICPIILLALSLDQLDRDVIETANLIGTSLKCLLVILFLAGNILFPVGLIRYAHYNSFKAGLQFSEILNFIKNNFGDYLVTILLSFAAVFLSFFGVIFCIVGICITYFMSILVKANLYGQLARRWNYD